MDTPSPFLPSPKLILFDLDGTLIPWDTQALFANFVLHKHPIRRLCHVPYLVCVPFYILRLISENTMKRLFLSYLCGLKKETIDSMAQEFAALYIPHQCYPSLIEQLEYHKKSGDVCILVTASPSLYAEALGKALGMREVLGTDVEPYTEFPLFPKLPHSNNKSTIKTMRLRALDILPPEEDSLPVGSVAYSDSKADLPMLSACQSQVLVNPNSSLSVWGKQQHHCSILRPPTPWKNRLVKVINIFQQFWGIFPLPPASS